MAVPLPQPIAPGGSATHRGRRGPPTCRARSRAPAPSATSSSSRSGFPKLGVLQDDGWNCHQFHAGTEFFSDYGVYDVSLTVPAGWPLGATGVAARAPRQRRRHDDASLLPGRRPRLRVDDEPGLPRADRALRASDAAAGRDAAAAAARARGQAERHFDATRTTLKYYGEWFGAYPYGHITIVDPAYQSGAGGMEYPTLFTAGTRWLAPPGVTDAGGRHRPRSRPPVLVRHRRQQRVRGRVDGRRVQHVLDARAPMAQVYEPNYLALRYFGGFVPWVFRDIALSRETDGNRLAGYRRDAEERRAVDADASATFPSTGGSITYNKTALWLNTLERWLGWPTLQRIMSTLLRALAVQASEAGRFLRHRERGQRPATSAGSSTRSIAARTCSTTASRT